MRPIYLISKTPYEGVIHVPVLSIHFFSPVIDFSVYEGVIFTSKQGILAAQRYSLDWDHLKCICVSEPTAMSARAAGAVDVEIGNGYGTSIPQLLASKKRSGKWLYLRPKVVAFEWVSSAKEQGFQIDEAIVYENVCNEEASNYLIHKEGILIFTSPSSIRCFLQNYTILPSHKVVVIGTTTQNALPSGVASRLARSTSVEAAVDLGRQIASEG